MKKITEFSQPPLSVVMNIDGKKQTSESESNINKNDTIFENDSDSYYRAEAEKELKGKLNIADYTTDQLKAYVVAHKMGVDVSKFASELYSVEQINFLAMLVTMGKDISKYIDNYNFDAGAEFVKMALEEERESQLRYEDTMI